ncbi:thioester reductase-like protein [Mycolicibacterium smegmatis]|uniref:NAD dependent epimerase/dehydratase family protein n=1 Tax=Mycolicibacterium smegmatis (strain MKD8) TaxID=1214915 RepID=A0A2U9PN41_MYCSE|nr:NAD dependent epimerase/dehydratase family protein [Mycolicibacterium smegmatis MKD8]CKH49098.1 thioester reductase-like protein [Mycolicibacterium smegmatis]STZ32481.1 thioester reductase-like protein [Mycolicibacterium smegmatis]VTP09446.1 Carboxylic acid reductase [Mycolicibacterium smegmatis]
MPTDSRQERLARRIAELHATDGQFAKARPVDAVTAAVEQPDMRLHQVVGTVMDAYADRPAIGERAIELVEDPVTGRTSVELLPRFDTLTYREVSSRVTALARAMHDDVRPGDRVCVLGLCQCRLRHHRHGDDVSRRGGCPAADERAGRSASTHRHRNRTTSVRVEHRRPAHRGRPGAHRARTRQTCRLRPPPGRGRGTRSAAERAPAARRRGCASGDRGPG